VHQVYWGIPITGSFEAEGSPSVFLATDRASMTGLVRPDGELLWWDALDKSPKQLPAVGDFDGDGAIEVIGIAYEDGIRCYNAASGEVKWRLAVPSTEVPSGVASADINGDGRDEAIFVIGKTIFCVGDTGSGTGGEYLWQVELPVPVGPPSIAIVDGDKRLSILLLGEDGYVYCVQ
jgi:outer membrane protein assembly factor BamB